MPETNIKPQEQDNINVTSWMDLITDPGTITLIICGLLLVPFFLLLVVSADKAQYIVNLYPTFAVGGIGTATSHAVTDWAKTASISKRQEQE